MPSQQTEPSVNTALGGLLKRMLGTCLVRSEHTQLIVGHPAWQLDNLITSSGRSPVVVEAEFMPAYTAEQEAADRLGGKVVGEPRAIEAAIALRYPTELRTADELDEALQQTLLSWCVLYDEFDKEGRRIRFPESGWLEGGIEDLADFVRLVSMPQKEVNKAADSLQAGINRAAAILDEMSETRRAVMSDIAKLLGMENLPQTRRMACAIIANALVFHERIAGMHEGVKPLHMVCGHDVPKPQQATLASWSQILAINYFPIFAISKDILEQLPSGEAARILAELRDTAQEIDSAGIDNAHDLTGRIFQRLIADRKYLATFYTRPASAALLARLAVSMLGGVDWADANAIGKLRIGDFACGTGALLSAVYDQIALRHEHTDRDPASLHTTMIEEVLYGCDVMPSAAHITSATLSGAYPSVGYHQSRIYTMQYGRQSDGDVKIGSLELLQSSNEPILFNTSDPALRTGSAGEETADQVIAEIPDEGFDLIIMNPPFVSNTKHQDAEDGVVNAAFAAYDSSDRDQEAMAARLKSMAKQSTYHGHAGIGSAFATIAHRKLRPGGVVALVLPVTLINGGSWEKLRTLIMSTYTDVSIISIAANHDDMAFSHDTGIADCLVIARKGFGPTPASQRRARFTSLRDRPRGLAEAAVVARSITSQDMVRAVEDGPYGGTPVTLGGDQVGETVDAPTTDAATGWGAARLVDATVAQVAAAVARQHLWLPASSEALSLPVTRLAEIGELGVHDSYLTLSTHHGPFVKRPASITSTYPSLCNHNAANETRLICEPDSEMQVIRGCEARAAEIWSSASRIHFNRDFRFTSQPLSVAVTERVSLGGRAWPHVRLYDRDHDTAFALWSNSTLGILTYWWHSSRQQDGRGIMPRNAIRRLPVLDPRRLSVRQLRTADDVLRDFRDLQLQPAYLADADPNRALLDRRVICDLLGFDEDKLRHGCADLPPSGAPNPPCMAAKRGPQARSSSSDGQRIPRHEGHLLRRH